MIIRYPRGPLSIQSKRCFLIGTDATFLDIEQIRTHEQGLANWASWRNHDTEAEVHVLPQENRGLCLGIKSQAIFWELRRLAVGREASDPSLLL